MKFFVKHLFAGLMILALTGVIALAKDHNKVMKASVRFSSDITVNGTMVKAGAYDLRFDEQTGNLEIMKGSKVIATTTAQLQKRSDKASATEVYSINNGGTEQLLSIVLRGEDENIVVGETAPPATGNN